MGDMGYGPASVSNFPQGFFDFSGFVTFWDFSTCRFLRHFFRHFSTFRGFLALFGTFRDFSTFRLFGFFATIRLFVFFGTFRNFS